MWRRMHTGREGTRQNSPCMFKSTTEYVQLFCWSFVLSCCLFVLCLLPLVLQIELKENKQKKSCQPQGKGCMAKQTDLVYCIVLRTKKQRKREVVRKIFSSFYNRFFRSSLAFISPSPPPPNPHTFYSLFTKSSTFNNSSFLSAFVSRMSCTIKKEKKKKGGARAKKEEKRNRKNKQQRKKKKRYILLSLSLLSRSPRL